MVLLHGLNPIVGILAISALCEFSSSNTTSETRYIALLIMSFLLSPVDKSILRLSVYHLKFCPDIPPKVVINEAIELAKKFSSDKSPGFVNGVLDAVLKKITAGKQKA